THPPAPSVGQIASRQLNHLLPVTIAGGCLGPTPATQIKWQKENPVEKPGLYALIFTNTPAGTTRRLSASTVRAVGSKMSITRLCVRISNCSRDFLSICGLRSTVYRSMRVGTGIGPQTRALVRLAWSTISFAEASRARWSYASIRILIRSPVISFYRNFRSNLYLRSIRLEKPDEISARSCTKREANDSV